MATLKQPNTVPANDAQLIQLVRTRLGRTNLKHRINISSCGFVVTLHGAVGDSDERLRLENIVRGVYRVEGVVNKLKVSRAD